MFILLRAINYVKNNFNEDLDEELAKKVNKDGQKTIYQAKLDRMIEIHTNDEELTDFQRHMLFSAPLIELLRVRKICYENMV